MPWEPRDEGQARAAPEQGRRATADHHRNGARTARDNEPPYPEWDQREIAPWPRSLNLIEIAPEKFITHGERHRAAVVRAKAKRAWGRLGVRSGEPARDGRGLRLRATGARWEPSGPCSRPVPIATQGMSTEPLRSISPCARVATTQPVHCATHEARDDVDRPRARDILAGLTGIDLRAQARFQVNTEHRHRRLPPGQAVLVFTTPRRPGTATHGSDDHSREGSSDG